MQAEALLYSAIGLFPPMFCCRLLRCVTNDLTSSVSWINDLGITVTKLLVSGAAQHYTAAFGTAWSLLGSLRNGQASLYLKHLLFREYIHKAVPLRTWSGPEGSRKLRFPDYVTMAQDGGRLSALRTGRLYPRKFALYSFLF